MCRIEAFLGPRDTALTVPDATDFAVEDGHTDGGPDVFGTVRGVPGHDCIDGYLSAI